MAISLALPIGVAIAVWLVEYGRPKALARVTELTIEAIAGIPSIVLALFGTVIFSSVALGFLSRTNEGVVFGRSFFAASAMLALEALPLIVASTREGLNAIPRHVREASYGVGKTKAATTRRILLPTCRPQIATGAMLGLGRIIGDTAIIVVLLGATQNFSPVEGAPFPLDYLRGAGTTLTNFVYEASPTGNLNQPEKAYAAAFVLLLMVLLLNAGDRPRPPPRPKGRNVESLTRQTERPAADPAARPAGPDPGPARPPRDGDELRRGETVDRRAAVLDPADGGRQGVDPLRRQRSGEKRVAADPPGRGAGADRPVGLRQDDPAALAQPPHRADRGGETDRLDPARRRRHPADRADPAAAPGDDGLPAAEPVPDERSSTTSPTCCASRARGG